MQENRNSTWPYSDRALRKILEDEQLFFHALNDPEFQSSISEKWKNEDLSLSGLPNEVAMACLDAVYLRTQDRSLLLHYNAIFSMSQAGGSLLPISRLKIHANTLTLGLIEAQAAKFSTAACDTEAFISYSAMYSLGRWGELIERGEFLNKVQSNEIVWRAKAARAVAFYKCRLYTECQKQLSSVDIDLKKSTAKLYQDGLKSLLDLSSVNTAKKMDIDRALHEASLREEAEAAFEHEDKGIETVDLFLKTYPGDEEWLPYCFRAIDKFAENFRKLVIVSDRGHNLIPELIHPYTYHEVDVPDSTNAFDAGPGYLMQQVVKLNWDQYSDADAVLMLDSDTILSRPITPDGLLENGRPIWFEGSWGAGIIWRAGAEFLTGRSIEQSHMKEHPFFLTRAATQGFRHHIYRRFRRDVGQIYFSQDIPAPISEFESIGGYLAAVYNHGYILRPWSPALTVRQFWSWGGVKSEFVDEIESMLATGW